MSQLMRKGTIIFCGLRSIKRACPNLWKGSEAWLFACSFLYIPILCEQTVKALVRLHWCTDSPEPSLVAYVISNFFTWAGSLMIKNVRWKLRKSVLLSPDIGMLTWYCNFACYCCMTVGHGVTQKFVIRLQLYRIWLLHYKKANVKATTTGNGIKYL